MSHSSSAKSMLGQQNKRLACDRCRGQKLKCIRSENSTTCQRCISAKAVCRLGTPRPVGRPPTVGLLTTGTGVFRQNESHQNCADDDQNTPRSMQTANPSLTGLDSPAQAGSQMSNFEDEEYFNLFSNTYMGDDENSLSKDWPMTNTEEMEGLSQRPIGQPSNVGSFEQFLHNADHFEISIASGSTSSAELGMDMVPNQTKMISAPASALQKHNQNAVSTDHIQSTLFPELSKFSASNLVESGFPSLTQPSGNSAAARNHRMQLLLQLGTSIHELQNVYSQVECAVPSVSDTFPTEFTGKVLQAATAFLKVLHLFSPDESTSSPVFDNAQLLQQPCDVPNIADAKDRSNPPPFNASRPSSANTNMRQSSNTYASSSSTFSTSRHSYVTDKPATLQLITCYLQLLQIYLLLFTAIHNYIRCTESAFRLPIWGNLSIGNAPLYPFSDFQIKLVLQVVAHVLEKTEAELGLSEGCRVSKKSAVEGSGILGRNVTAHFIEMCMSDSMNGAEDGRGMIAKMKDVMGRLADLLNGPIWS